MLGMVAIVAPVRAATSYATVAAFNAATNGDTNITFTGDICSGCTSLTDQLVTFTANTGTMLVTPVSGWPNGNTLENGQGDQNIFISHSGSFTAFAVNIVTFSGGGFPVDVTFNEGATPRDFSLTSASSQGGAIFFGVTTTAPITNLEVVNTLNSNFFRFALDNVEVGNVNPSTPDVPTLILMATGLIALALLSRRRLRI